jgi:glycosyltransferase 2 family protein
VSSRARLLVSVGLLGLLAWRADWGQIAAAVRQLRPGYALAALVTFLLTQLVSASRWRLLARPLGFDHPRRHFAGMFYVGMYFNLFLPTSVGGDVVRAWYLGGPGKRGAAMISVLADRGSGLLVLLAMAATATLLSPDPVPAWVKVAVAALAAGGAVGLVGLFALGKLTRRWRDSQADAPGWVRKVRGLLMAATEAWWAYRRRPGLALGATLLSVVVQAASVLIVALLDRALGVGVPVTYYAIAVPLVSLLTLLPVSLNGMGVREASMGLLLAPAGVSGTLAGSLAFLWFLVMAAAGLVGGGVYLLGRFTPPPDADAPAAPEVRRAA